MKQTSLTNRKLRENAVIGLDDLAKDDDFKNAGETMDEFMVPDGTIIEFPKRDQFAAWIRTFKGNKIPYVSGLQVSNDEVWLEIPASVFRNNPIQEDMEEFRLLNEFGMELRSKEKDLFRWELLAGKKVRFDHTSLRCPGYDKKTNSRITNPEECKPKTLWKLTIVR